MKIKYYLKLEGKKDPILQIMSQEKINFFSLYITVIYIFIRTHGTVLNLKIINEGSNVKI